MIHRQLGGAIAAIVVSGSGVAFAQSCPPSLTSIVNGTPTDATVVMSNFNALAACFNNPIFGGQVGIQNPTPTDALDVGAPVVFGGTSGERLSLNTASIGFNRKVATGLIYSSSAYAYQFQHNGSTTATSDYLGIQVYSPSGSSVTPAAWTVNGAGQVTVGGGASTLLFYVNGTAGGTSGWTTVSDGRLKTNIDDLGDGVETVMRLRPVRFEWRSSEDRTVGKDLALAAAHPQVGFIAQEVAPVVPEAVVAPAAANGGV
jgi:hypothetical protein